MVAGAFVGVAVCRHPAGAAEEPKSLRGPQVAAAVHHDTSPPLFLIRPVPAVPMEEHEPVRPGPRDTAEDLALLKDAVVVAAPVAPPATPTPWILTNLLGLGAGFTGPAGPLTDAGTPPDTCGDVGPSHYVQIVNTSFTIFDEATGSAIFGPAFTNTLFAGFGGPCETTNSGDGIVLYDPIANRWLISQFSVSGNMECVAVSATADPTGAWNRYAFAYPGFLPDYPKLGVWPDAYYATFNLFSASAPQGMVCAYDRAKMLAGAAATQQCFNVGASYVSLLPSDLDGKLLPPAGSPNYVLDMDWSTRNSLYFWRFHVDWGTPANTTLTGPQTFGLSLPATPALTFVPQAGTSTGLDNLSDRLMYRLSYRNFGDHESLVTTRGVRPNPQTGTAGIDWFELRLPQIPGGPPTFFQEGHYYSPNGWAWMGSAAMDQAGNIAMGYSVSSSAIHPQIRFTGRLLDDPPGQMTVVEGSIVDGGGSQNSNRWGDYSMMSVDPVDDCTFWYTTEYISAIGAAWSTRVAAFTLPGCPPPLAGRADGPVCAGGTIHLSATARPGATFAWTGPNGFTSTSAAPTIASASAANAGTYVVTCTAFGAPCGAVGVSVAVVPNGAVCDDGNACTRVDACQAGACVGSSLVTCGPSADACVAGGACNPATGLCAATADGSTCRDANDCVTGDACRAGLCVAAPATNLIGAGVAPLPTSMAGGDLNFDGIPDLVTVGAAVSVQLGGGDGTFETAAYPSYPGSAPVAAAMVGPSFPTGPTFAVADALSDSVWVYVLNNFGFFDLVPQSIPAGSGPSAMVAADFDQDGRRDLAVADRTGNAVRILLRTLFSPYFVSSGSWSAGEGPVAIAASDLNLDGLPDLVVANGGSRDLTILLNAGGGNFVSGMGSPLPVGRSPSGVAVGDFDGDGRPDLAASNEGSSSVSVWLNRGASGFLRAPGASFAAGAAPTAIAAGDFTGDGRADLAVLSNAGGSVRLLSGDGTGRFAVAPGSPISVGADPRGIVALDANLDGTPDVVVGLHTDGVLMTLLETPPLAPDGSNCEDGNICVTGDTCSAGTCLSGAAPKDLDADGHIDTVCGGDDCADGNALVWHLPAPVSGLQANGKSPTNLTWSDQSAASGPGTVYDLASGPLAPGGSFASASCLASGGGPAYSDASPSPLPGAGFWYLSRARNACGTATYGTPQADASIAVCP